MDDRELVNRILRYDRAAAEAIVHEYAGLIYTIFTRETDDPDCVESRFEEFFDLLARNDYQILRMWDGKSILRSYLAAVAMKMVLENRSRSGETDQKLSEELLKPLRESLRSALHTVSEQDRRIIQLRRFDGLGFREIGMRLSMKPSAVGVMLHRAEKRLRDQVSMTFPALFRDFVQ
ncbi:MAG: sigma-70 family RNA polymerase sigma factor [Gammaproteobacteria bacterium]|nr:sigma-70 family RNA polymerase sigma factor [Gammaproteobacteria bacterium]